MMKYFSKTKIIALVVITLITTTVAASVFTFSLKKENRKTGVTYIGEVDARPVYRLTLNNKTNDVYFVSISDKNGNVVYCQDVKGVNIVSDYKLDNKIYKSGSDLTLTVTDLNGKTVGTYNIAKDTSSLNKTLVSK